MKRRCDGRRPLAVVAALLFVLAGCGSDGGGGLGGGGITSGTLGGFGFTVVYGDVTQSNDDGPVSTGAGGALILLNDAVDGLYFDPFPDMQVGITFRAQDGGSAMLVVYGQASDDLVGGLGLRYTRVGDSMDYEYHFGIDGVAEGGSTFGTDPADAGAVLSLVGNFEQGVSPSTEGIASYHPDETFFGCSTDDGMAGPNPNTTGLWDRVGIGFLKATILSVFGDETGFNQC